MIHAILLILACQLGGEVAVRGLGVSLPGPVVGMVTLVVLIKAFPRVEAVVRPVAKTILGNLSLLFVPAGVGIIGHLSTLGAQAGAILAAVVASTVLAMVIGALVFSGVARLTGSSTGPEEPGDD